MSNLKKIVDFLAPAGIVLAAGALGWSRAGKELPGGLRPWLIAALALVLLHLVLRWDDVAKGLGRRQLKYGTNTFVLVRRGARDPRRRQLDRVAPVLARRPDQGPALQPLRPDPQGARRPEGRDQGHATSSASATWAARRTA